MKLCPATLALAILGLLSAVTAVIKRTSAPDTEAPPVAKVEAPKHVTPLRTYEHDGHWFVTQYKGGIIHHPGCSCLSNKTAEKP